MSLLSEQELAEIGERTALVLDSNGAANYVDGDWEDFYDWQFLMYDSQDFWWLRFLSFEKEEQPND